MGRYRRVAKALESAYKGLLVRYWCWATSRAITSLLDGPRGS